MSKFFKALIVLSFFIFPTFVFAHQPRFVSENTIEVLAPEVSKAYYAELSGVPHTYYINSDKEFNLYLNLLVPKSSNPEGRFSASLYDMATDEELYFLDGDNFEWTEFFEPFGHDTYLEGPEYKTVMPAGSYRVAVFNQFNQGKYALAIGELENFDFAEIMNVYKLLPQLKKNFFNEIPASFLLSPFGAIEVAVIIIGMILLMSLLRLVLRKIFKNIPVGSVKLYPAERGYCEYLPLCLLSLSECFSGVACFSWWRVYYCIRRSAAGVWLCRCIIIILEAENNYLFLIL